MATRKVTATILIKDIFFNEELYPRASYNWQTSYDYAESMKTGAKFPPIVLAVYKGKKCLVDGKHRLEAHKMNKLKKIQAVIYSGWNEKKIFEEAVRANIAHGRTLSPYEKRKIGLKFREWKYPAAKISDLIQVPQNKLNSFIGSRLVNSITGEVEYETIVKSGIKHLAGSSISIEDMQMIEKEQRPFNMHDQIHLLEQVINLIRNNLFDRKDKTVKALLKKIKGMI